MQSRRRDAARITMSDRPDAFEWSGGHPALDFVNTLDERPFDHPIENLAAYRDLVRFTELAGLVEPALAAALRALSGPACSRVARQARELREHLHDVLAAVHDHKPMLQEVLDAIAAAIQAAHSAQVLVASTSTSLASYRWSRPTHPQTPLHACALAIENLLMDVDRRRIRKCAASDCGVYFVDMSKAHRRQWCSMKNCGNREKQRRWRSATH
jgi:predicted RNA-binding Zn ribbon-like protein